MLPPLGIMKNNTTIPSPKVKIDVNEFVLGDIKNDPSENRKYDYYTVTLPNDGEFILIDWQADSPSLIINVGEERPNKTNADFIEGNGSGLKVRAAHCDYCPCEPRW